ncbi:hypothetical protein MKW94_022487 [Papaver nudicaule]|uniref:Uncharacterized protein n=1 Tax=Papaver nudicaule TaxID=74823 RepID=A0AA41RUC1_PAPNU|nr:hypothetical protein [Papaver nudicaule]
MADNKSSRASSLAGWVLLVMIILTFDLSLSWVGEVVHVVNGYCGENEILGSYFAPRQGNACLPLFADCDALYPDAGCNLQGCLSDQTFFLYINPDKGVENTVYSVPGTVPPGVDYCWCCGGPV